MSKSHRLTEEFRLALCFAGVGLVGFCIDAGVLRLGLGLGLPAWGARIVSLSCAMQATFAINGLRVFGCLERDRLLHQWSAYMLANGFGNFCNYWIFLTMVSTHWPVISNRYVALATGSLSAWLINFTGTRLVAFRRVSRTAPAAPDGPSRGRGPA
jgi:putative flippase GtrA